MNELIQLGYFLGGSVVTVVTTFWGFKSVSAKLLNKVDVVTYQNKTTELHNTINDLRVRVAVLEMQARK